MLPLGKLDPATARAFGRALADPTIARAVESFLKARQQSLQHDLNLAAQAALFNEKSKPHATALLGHYREVSSWLGIVGRFIETGEFDTSKLKPVNPNA